MNHLLMILLMLALLAVPPLGASTAQEDYDAGTKYFQKSQYDQALPFFKAAAQKDPQNWLAFQMEGTCYAQQDQKGPALQALKQSLKLHPDNPALEELMVSLKAASPRQPPSQGTSNQPGEEVVTEKPSAKNPLDDKKVFLRLNGCFESANLGDLAKGANPRPVNAQDNGLTSGYLEAGYCLDKFDGISVGLSLFSDGTDYQAVYSGPLTALTNVLSTLFWGNPFYSVSLNYYRFLPDGSGCWYATSGVGLYTASLTYAFSADNGTLVPVMDQGTLSGDVLGFTVGFGRELYLLDGFALDASVVYRYANIGKMLTGDGLEGLALTSGGELTVENAGNIGQAGDRYARVDLSGFELRLFFVYYPF